MAEVARLDAILGADVSGFEAGMKKASGDIVNFNKLAAASAELKPFSGATSSALAAANSVEKLSNVLAQLKIEQAGATSASELSAYNNAIKVTTAELKSLSSVGTGGGFGAIGKSLTEGLSSVRQLAYILPGIGIAGIFNLAFEAISKGVSALGLFKDKTQDLNVVVENFGKKQGDEIANLRILSSIATDTSQAYNVRKDAVDQLQKLYPQYLKNISDEAILTGKATDAINLINKALVQKAYYEAASSQASTLAGKALDLDREKGELLQKQLDIARALYLEQNKPAKTADERDQKGLNIFTLKGQYDDLNAAIKQNAIDQDAVNKQVDFYINQAGRFSSALTTGKTGIEKQKEAVDGLNAAIKKLPFQDAIAVETGDNLHATVQKTLDGEPSLKLKFKFDESELDKETSAIEKLLTDALNNSIADIGQGIGNVLLGKGNPFAAVFETIGNAIKELGKQIIVLGGLGVALGKALKVFIANPALALGVGIALEALGTIIASKGITAHAEGGIFTQPTLWGNHLIGEKGPEALVPLDQLNGLSMGGTQRIVVEGRISGRDIVLVQNRQNLSNTRNYGNNFNTIH